ncbi:MAG: Nudix family hydrolase [Methylobacter sp.]|uniref:Nudix family hydrolase n=1 Tax=Methylobacter sp. TaxID=2051955 RepID=UPI002587559B|nr:Nudix family hydrolase [Methylobacter sp.]MCL7420377.1 Nudix family hydrolase [Methylobacter sp.]
MKPLQVAVGVVKDTVGRILISLRDRSLHQGGLWEFPGGKIEPMETAEQALSRELKEELDITVEAACPLITLEHQYPDLAVQLHVFLVEQFSGRARGCEGQPLKWVAPDELDDYVFPAANGPIIMAARLPAYYAILDDADESKLLANLQKILNRGVKLVQARLKSLPFFAVQAFIDRAYPLCKRHGALLLMNSAVERAYELHVDGVHLTGRHLMALEKRPGHIKWLAASCHSLQELRHAQAIGIDFAVLAPVLPTQTHPGAPALGWQQFSELVSEVNLPVYALGGMSLSCLMTARQAGGQGIAAIRGFLD